MLEKILKKIEAENAVQDVWIVGPETGHLLHWLVRVVAPKTVLEIGTSVGYSALWMASALQKNGGGRLFTVESHAERFERAQRNIAEAGLQDWIVQLKGHAPEVFSTSPSPFESLDFVFFDATKQEHPSYLEAVLPYTHSGTMIAVDNVQSHRFGQMQKFIDALHNDKRFEVVELPVGDGLLLARVV